MDGECRQLAALVLLVCTMSACRASDAGNHCAVFRDSNYEALYKSDSFSREDTDPNSGAVYVEVSALRCMTQEPDALVRLRDVVVHGSLPAQLYALTGLHALQRSEYDRLVARYLSSTETVPNKGDVAAMLPVSKIAQAIGGAYYTRELLPGLYPSLPKPASGFEVEFGEPK